MNFFMQRLKAFAAVVAPAIATALIKGAEAATGFDIPNDWELYIISFVTGLVVHQVPNRAPTQ
jgi:hypothetical protein